jgi:3-(3-hydroxy-phenyl)propionate hydroxylase
MRVGIIGYGLVGNFAALALAQQGQEVLLFEAKQRQQLATAKAGRLDAQAFRLLRQLGLPEQDLQKLFYPLQGTQLVDAKGQVIRSFVHPQSPGLAPLYGFRQALVQAFLQKQAQQWTNIHLHDECQVKAIDLQGDTVQVQTNKGSYSVDYLWVCDGQDSQTAQLLDLPYEDFGYARKTLYLELASEQARPQPPYAQTFCDAKIPTTRIAHTPHLQRWAFEFGFEEPIPQDPLSLLPPQEREGWQLLSQFVHPFQVQMLENWQVFERIFFLGDAAHVMPPYLGMGLACSWKDVANLAWKCRLVAEGQAHVALLHSYELERRAEALRLIQINQSIHQLFPGRFTRYFRYFLPFQRKKELVLDTEYRYGVLSKGGGQTLPLFRLQYTNGKSYPLEHFCGLQHFVLLALDENPVDTLWVDQLHFLASLHTQFVELCPRNKNLTESSRFGHRVQNPDGLLERWLKRKGWRYLLIRPDGLVFGGARTETQLDALLEELWQQIKTGVN